MYKFNKEDTDILFKIQISFDGKYYKAIYANKAYIIGKQLYFILEQLKEGRNIESIVELLNVDFSINKNELKQIIIDKLEIFISKVKLEKDQKNSYIKYRRVIFNEEIASKISLRFTSLFKRKIFFSFIILSLILHLYFVLNNHYNPIDYYYDNFSVTFVLLTYLLAFIIMLFHEIGHAAAAKYFKAKSKEIGFGFYFVFPVLFANVTPVWSLDKHKRVIVNLGGVYFQAIVNIIVILILLFVPEDFKNLRHICYSIFNINVIVILYALFPYFKNDGYWIYSDYFNLPNLQKKSLDYPYVIFSKIRKWFSGSDRKLVENHQIDLPLFLYSLFNHVFIIFIAYRILNFMIGTSVELHQVINLEKFNSVSNSLIIKSVILIGMMVYIFSKIYKYLKKKNSIALFK